MLLVLMLIGRGCAVGCAVVPSCRRILVLPVGGVLYYEIIDNLKALRVNALQHVVLTFRDLVINAATLPNRGTLCDYMR